MANIIEITNRTQIEGGPGLNTHLVFDGGVEIVEGKKKIVNVKIDTCIDSCKVPGEEENTYHILVQGDNISNLSLFNQRCGKDEYVDKHFSIVDRLKKSYLKKIKTK